MQTLTLREYEDCAIDVLLDVGQLDALRKHRIDVTPSTDAGYPYVLRPSSYIGTMRLGDLSIVVRPKVPIDRVMFLVAYALDPNDWKKYFDLSQKIDVLESIIPAFVHHTRQAIRRGLLQGYRAEEEALHTVRGRIRFHDQINRRFGIPLPVEVAYDEFTEDIEENRLLKTALHRLPRLPVRSEQSRRGVNGLRPAFNTVELGDYRQGTPSVQYTRLNSHYRPAVELARLIIDNSSLELFHGEVSGASFMLDMNMVFEQFLFVALREALGLSGREWKRGERLTLDVDGKIRLNPDLSWWSNGHCCFVGDAKYKRLMSERFPNADIYQVLAYCTAVDLPSGLLVYAAGESETGRYRIKHTDKTIEVESLNLAGQPEDILAQVNRLAEKVKDHSRTMIAVA